MPRHVKSTSTVHHFPEFYACYLLKSIRTPRATATYIGSTPSPPRRIRQHNGEITQGAFKTRHNRPWLMQMIVYGFPSKLTALQFEWAWQHPHNSRHLRDDTGKNVFEHNSKSRYLKTSVSIARNMICSHPYNTWPLRVKIFTVEAEKAWLHAARDPGNSPFPEGFTHSVELEGVDGRSGNAGSGRTGPIDVTDGPFTSEHLHKFSVLIASEKSLNCFICREALEGREVDPLTMALCPNSTCMAISHLSCLCNDFLEREASSSFKKMIPRGGKCRLCGSYVLWGDVVRGCYRRKGNAPADFDEENESGNEDEVEADGLPGRAIDVPVPASKKPSRRVAAQNNYRRRRIAPQKHTLAHDESSQGELFDLNVSSSSGEDSAGGHSSIAARSPQTGLEVDRVLGLTTPDDLPGRSHHAVHPTSSQERPRVNRITRNSTQASQLRAALSGIPVGQTAVDRMPTSSTIDGDGITRQSPVPYSRSPSYIEVYSSDELNGASRFDAGRGGLGPRQGEAHDSSNDADSLRLSRAMSTLSMSSGVELPSTVQIVSDYGKRKATGDDGLEDEVILLSD